MTRKKKEKQKPGKKSWVFGTKFAFFTRYRTDWETAQAAGRDKAGHFYTLITKKYLAKYGDLPSMEDLPEDTPDPEDNDLDLGLNDMTEEELKQHQEDFTELRTRISQWYRTYFSGINRSNASLMQQVIQNFTGMSTPKPKRLTNVDQFSKEYYNSMIKLEYEKDLEAAKAAFKVKLAAYEEKQQAKAASSGHSEGTGGGESSENGEEEDDEQPKRPVSVNVRRATTHRLWKVQTEEFRVQVKEHADAAHKEAVAEWEEQRKHAPPKSAEQYDHALRELYQLVKNFAEGVQIEFGMAVSVLLCGPIGRSNGAIDVRSIHVGETIRGKLAWPQFDPDGYRLVEQTMIKFGMKVFSPSDCSARVLGSDAALFPEKNLWTLPDASSSPALLVPAQPDQAASIPDSSSIPRRKRKRKDKVPENAQPTDGAQSSMSSVTAITVLSPPNPIPFPIANVRPRRGNSLAPSLPIQITFLAGPPNITDIIQTSNKPQTRAISMEPLSSREVLPLPDFIPAGFIPRRSLIHASSPMPPNNTHVLASPDSSNDPPAGMPNDYNHFHPELRAALIEFRKGSEWDGWQDAVDSYLAYERKGGYIESGKTLRTEGKPEVLAVWYKNHRKVAEIPSIGTLGNLKDWNEEWKTWWGNMQPDDRIEGDCISGRPEHVDWGVLKVAFGKHGLWPVLLTLFWWGYISNSDGGRAADPVNWLNWNLACDDFCWAMGSLVENGLKPLEKMDKSRNKVDASLKGKRIATTQGFTAPSSSKRRRTEPETPLASTSSDPPQNRLRPRPRRLVKKA